MGKKLLACGQAIIRNLHGVSLFVCRRLPTNKNCSPPLRPLRLRGKQIKQLPQRRRVRGEFHFCPIGRRRLGKNSCLNLSLIRSDEEPFCLSLSPDKQKMPPLCASAVNKSSNYRRDAEFAEIFTFAQSGDDDWAKTPA